MDLVEHLYKDEEKPKLLAVSISKKMRKVENGIVKFNKVNGSKYFDLLNQYTWYKLESCGKMVKTS